MDSGLVFGYGENDTVEIIVRPIVRVKELTAGQRELLPHTDEERGEPTSWTIHAGYHRVLAGFLKEIAFMEKGGLKSHNCLFRATYLSKVLDLFVAELPRVRSSTPASFRSRVLNPILQRHLRGVLDHEPELVKGEVGGTRELAGKFYLTLDPLDPTLANEVLRNLLYIWPVRLSLLYLLSQDLPDENSYMSGLRNTEWLFEERAKISDEDWDAVALTDVEEKVVLLENLQPFFKGLLGEVEDDSTVSHPVLFLTSFSHLKSPAAREQQCRLMCCQLNRQVCTPRGQVESFLHLSSPSLLPSLSCRTLAPHVPSFLLFFLFCFFRQQHPSLYLYYNHKLLATHRFDHSTTLMA